MASGPSATLPMLKEKLREVAFAPLYWE